ncbi:MAG: HAD family phosphatase [Ruminococcaceae bacterium]|nr:HAD family phosphatase [Oscillospiraceae bacterium]
MKYKMLAVDMDGTLLTHEKIITKRNFDALMKAKEKGVLTVVSTGRAVAGVDIYDEIVALESPVILCNGAEIVKFPEGNLLFKQAFERDVAEKVISEGLKRNTTLCIWSNGKLYANVYNDNVRIYEGYSRGRAEILSDMTPVLDAGITKIVWYDEPEKITAYLSEMKSFFGNTSSCVRTAPEFLEFFDPTVSKATAVEAIAADYGIKNEEIICIGDGYNDVEMIKLAGLGVAMGNAPDDVKSLADFVTETNANDGVAFVIEKFILENA